MFKGVLILSIGLAAGAGLFRGSCNPIYTTESHMAILANAALYFRLDNGEWPEKPIHLVHRPVSAGVNWNGPYIVEKMLYDEWGHELEFFFSSDAVVVISKGKNGAIDSSSFGDDRILIR